ncbi:MAG: DUF4252 domain-containing protein [Cyclobacteriaceae bacterium]|nr:DUF4252 domain-containing protein [Cyclobacteriaceae bacterium]
MKNITALILLITSLSFGVNAQSDIVTAFFNKYADNEDFTEISVSSRMFGLFTDMEVENEEDQEVLDAISKLTGLKMLVKDNAPDGMDLYKELMTKIPKDGFDELMSLRENGKLMKFMIKEKNGKINELVLVSGGDSDFFVIRLLGEIDLKQVSKLSKKMDIQGLDKLENLEDKN